jgi:hypothetical protein
MVKYSELLSPVVRLLASRATPTAAKAASCVSGKAAARRSKSEIIEAEIS